MDKKRIITISGKPGSGKSSTADKVAELLGYSRYSAGDMVRNLLAVEKITLAEYNKMAILDLSRDQKIDALLRDLRDKNDLVIDSRLGFYWLPESFKVYLDLDLATSSQRIFDDAKNNRMRTKGGEFANSIEEVSAQVNLRIDAEQQRFRDLYGVDPYEQTAFDLIIDTSKQSPQTVALTICEAHKRWLINPAWKKERVSL